MIWNQKKQEYQNSRQSREFFYKEMSFFVK